MSASFYSALISGYNRFVKEVETEAKDVKEREEIEKLQARIASAVRKLSGDILEARVASGFQRNIVQVRLEFVMEDLEKVSDCLISKLLGEGENNADNFVNSNRVAMQGVNTNI